jgi:hypothetical protein
MQHRELTRSVELRRGSRGAPPPTARNCAVLLVVIAAALTLGVGAASATPAPSFAAPKSYAVGESPYSVALGDLNGDGKLDVAVANSDSDTISVLVNGGGGRLGSRRDYPTGDTPRSVALADLDGDGTLDLAVANTFSNTVSVLLNAGDGRLTSKRDYATGDLPNKVAIGDLSGDGKPDLAIANDGGPGGGVSVLLNSGDGSFQPKRDYATAAAMHTLAIGDLNGDGRPDLVAADGSDHVSVLFNRSDGSFGSKRDYAAGGSVSVALADLNGDGRPDLATGQIDDHLVTVFINAGDGHFGARRHYKTRGGPSSIAIGDLNSDGKPDLVTANLDASTVSLLVNRGDARFEPSLEYRAGHRPEKAAIGDLTGDGRPDLVTADTGFDTPAATVSVLANTPGLCAVQDVRRSTFLVAKRTLARAHCRVGKVRRTYSKSVGRGRVISQKPSPYTVLPNGGRVNLVLSRGRKR